jgi:Zn-dependent protease
MGTDQIFYIIILIMSVVIHEVAHGYAANLLGDKTAEYQGRLTLNPLRHLDPVGSVLIPAILIASGSRFIIGWAKPVPFNPYNLRNQRWGEAIVAGAGPAVNLLIAIIFGLIIRFGQHTLAPSFIAISVLITLTNILLAVFNLSPVPPLDGSKILFAFLPITSQMRSVIERNGLILSVIYIFFLWQFVAPIASILFTAITGITI